MRAKIRLRILPDQIFKQPSFLLTRLLVLAAGFSAEGYRSSLFVCASHKREGAERRQAHMCSLRATSTHRLCEAGFALRRSTAAFEIPGAPLPLTAIGFRRKREGVRDIDPRPHNGPGGCSPGTPGTCLRDMRAGAAPDPPFRCAYRTPLMESGCAHSSANQISVNSKI